MSKSSRSDFLLISEHSSKTQIFTIVQTVYLLIKTLKYRVSKKSYKNSLEGAIAVRFVIL